MAISLTCPACEGALKVKDELAGRKVKCPKCGGIVLVQAAEPEPEEPEEPQEEEQPRKKKKKKKKQKSNLMLYVAIGGVLLAVSGIGVTLYFMKEDTPPPAPPPVAQVKPEPPPLLPTGVNEAKKESKRVSNSIYARATQLPDARNVMQQIGLAYRSYCTTHNNGPAKLEDLSPEYENNAHINEAIKQGWIVFCWGVSPEHMPEGPSNTIVAYESAPDPDRRRIVVFGDTHVVDVFEDDFEKMPCADKK